MIGFIYIIKSPNTDKYYIGSTTKKTINIRLSYHKSDYLRYLKGKYGKVMSFEIIKEGEPYIELLEQYTVENKKELLKYETNILKMHKGNGLIVNKRF